jgi:cob(I)alamin adenosyltransferase
MANRLTRIVTRTGDDGTTGIADGSRLPKDSPRITAIGSVDELNSQLGVLLAEPMTDGVRAELLRIQNDLFDLGGMLALPGSTFDAAKLARLDEAITYHNADLPPLKEFILPGGCRPAALCHVARTVARRAERDYLQLIRNNPSSNDGLRYLNRLSDLLFVLSRVLNRASGHAEVYWHK